MRAFQELGEKAFVVLSLFFFTGAVSGLVSSDNALNSVREMLICVGHSLTWMFVVLRWKQVFAVVIKEKLLWILIATVCASVIWSDFPMKTLEEILPLLRVTLFGIYFAARFTIKEQLQLLSWAFGIAALLSLIVCVALPSYGVVGVGLIVGQEELVHSGAWRGVYNHKTFLGSIMSLGALILMFYGIDKYKYRYPWMIGAAFLITIFVLLRSTTIGALLIFIISLFLVLFFHLEQNKFGLFLMLFVSFLLVGSLIAMIIVSNAETIFGSFGKDATISGRTLIWPLLINKIQERPWLGYGYHTFWKEGWEGQVADIWRGLIAGFEPPHAHNGFLEICLDIGAIGLAIFVVWFVFSCLRSLVWLHKNKTVEGLAPIVLLIHILLLSLTESYLMRGDIYWLIYVAMTLSMYRSCQYKRYLIYLDKPLSSYVSKSC
ncbi:lipid A core-O-antigen ligase-like enyme [Rivularia sp. PCC 7116]|uniref:O-antigen ligase family protein n=1 Tax=Rivularia sp. PCC 7116 TaxID=373994 RepID=UPI00029F1AC5|nr:O-antigen ligase [Rivularia sp. PCC 7116]AFY54574.1 lipid A core-O-antigen ligase-like enyme [Rivularia sp. PCC 7116]